MDPSNPAGGIPTEVYAGPYGFLAAVAFFLFLAARELRRYRQIDVETYKADLAAARVEAEQDDERFAKELAARDDIIEDLKADLGGLRAQHLADLRQGQQEKELLIRENGALRALLATDGTSTEGITG